MYIGSRLSIVTKSGKGYVGRLVEVDLEDASLILDGVRSYRPSLGPNAIQEALKSQRISANLVKFRGAEIKDVLLLSSPEKKKQKSRESEEKLYDYVDDNFASHEEYNSEYKYCQRPPKAREWDGYGLRDMVMDNVYSEVRQKGTTPVDFLEKSQEDDLIMGIEKLKVKDDNFKPRNVDVGNVRRNGFPPPKHYRNNEAEQYYEPVERYNKPKNKFSDQRDGYKETSERELKVYDENESLQKKLGRGRGYRYNKSNQESHPEQKEAPRALYKVSQQKNIALEPLDANELVVQTSKFAKKQRATEPHSIYDDVKNFYQKDSFFDDISCEAKARELLQKNDLNRHSRKAEENNLNLQTFGETGHRSKNGNNRYRRKNSVNTGYKHGGAQVRKGYNRQGSKNKNAERNEALSLHGERGGYSKEYRKENLQPRTEGSQRFDIIMGNCD